MLYRREVKLNEGHVAFESLRFNEENATFKFFFVEITMVSYTTEQHVQMIKLCYQNECSLVKTLRASHPFYGRRDGPSKSTLQRLVAKFDSTGSVNNLPTPVRQRNVRSAKTIAPVRVSVQCTGEPEAVNSSPCTRTRPFAGFNLANFASPLGPAPVQHPTDPGAQGAPQNSIFLQGGPHSPRAQGPVKYKSGVDDDDRVQTITQVGSVANVGIR
ncbi:hypothetical protein NQ318_001639 [Aromia moschata]|uniref:DUF4817 domain-containing protein n=1 Tax=Aromia moschata TaxID=1265417 RepID=A0AAV8Y248_9CUCU|nr:hypothetical protein NQ318_001639 [Aromia moschata]